MLNFIPRIKTGYNFINISTLQQKFYPTKSDKAYKLKHEK